MGFLVRGMPLPDFRLLKGAKAVDKPNKIRWGQIYSPSDVVHYILNKTLQPLLASSPVETIKVLEPSCGDGQFLQPLLDLLLVAYTQRNYRRQEALLHILQNNMYGIDIDPGAIAATRQAIRLRAGREPMHVHCGNTLDKRQVVAQVPLVPNYYDAIVGNPPYVTWEIDDAERAYYRNNYQTAKQGKLNLYRLFIERAVELLKPDGYLGFICPSTYLTDRDSCLLRKLLLEQTHILEIVCLAENAGIFPNVTQATTILIVQKKSQILADHQVKVKKVHTNLAACANGTSLSITQRYWHDQPEGIFRLLPASYQRIVDKLYCGLTLGKVAEVYQGEVNLTIHKEYLHDNPVEGTFPLLRGRHITPYGFYPITKSDKLCYFQPTRFVRDHALYKRLVLQQISNMAQGQRLKCGLLIPVTPVYCGNSTNYILLPDQDLTKYYYLMALCHSRAWNFLFALESSTNHITVRELVRLPIPCDDIRMQKKVALLVKGLLQSQDKTTKSHLQQRLDQLIYQMFGLDQEDIKEIEDYFTKAGKGVAFI
jgi:adenine-specific DNA-methyltransferase